MRHNPKVLNADFDSLLIDSNNSNISISSGDLQQRRKQEPSETAVNMIVAEYGSAKEGEKTKVLPSSFLKSYHDVLDLEKTLITRPAVSTSTTVDTIINTLDDYDKMLTMYPTNYIKRAAILEKKAQYLSRILRDSADCSLEVLATLSTVLEYTLTRKELLEFKIECQMKFAEFQKELSESIQTMTHIQQNNLFLNKNQSANTDGTIIHERIQRNEKSRSWRISI